MNAPRRAGLADADTLSRLFAAAFLYDPIFDWIARPGPHRARALERFFYWVLQTHALPHGAAWIGEGAGAVFVPPGTAHRESGIGEFLRLLFLFARLCGLMRLSRGLRFSAAIERNHPHPPHYYLAFFAVAPRLQGQGVGTAMIDALLAEADARRLPVYLENSNPKNDAFYKRCGFERRRNIAPIGAPKMTAMWRPEKLL
jgi:GNAT superfamily N-acetyltransferase